VRTLELYCVTAKNKTLLAQQILSKGWRWSISAAAIQYVVLGIYYFFNRVE